MMKYFRGLFGDTFLECEAEDEKAAQKILKDKLIKMIQEEAEPVITWEIDKPEDK